MEENNKSTQDYIAWTPEIVSRSGLSESTIRRLEKKGLFPKRQAIGLRKKGLPESVFTEWLKRSSSNVIA